MYTHEVLPGYRQRAGISSTKAKQWNHCYIGFRSINNRANKEERNKQIEM
jgi:hypothetical protein